MEARARARRRAWPRLEPPIDLGSSLETRFVERVAFDEALEPIAAYVYGRARAEGTPVAARAMQALRSLHRTNDLFCEVRHAELCRRLAAFHEASIPIVPLKGTSLAERLYPGIGARALGWDIDLFVGRGDVARASAILEREGFRAIAARDRYDRPFERSDANGAKTTIELHAELLPRWFRTDDLVERFWERASPPRDGSVPAWRLDTEDELLHLCAHLVKDQLEGRPTLPHLRHGLDIHLALERWGPAIDWPSFVGRAHALQLHVHAAAAFAFVRHWFGTPVPPAVTAALPGWKRELMERHIWPLTGRARGRFTLPKPLRLLVWILALDDVWSRRVDHLGWALSETLRPRA